MTPVEPESEDEPGSGGLPEAGEEEEGDEGAPDLSAIESRMDRIEGTLEQIVSMLQGGGGETPPGVDEEPPAPPPAPEAGPAPEGGKTETVYRVNESSLIRELNRLRALREGVTGYDKPATRSGVAKQSKFVAGAAKKAKPMNEETDEDMGADAMTEEEEVKHSKPIKATPTKEAKKAPKSAKGDEPAAKVMAENRDLKVRLERHAEAVETLRTQLTEMNLFNAKLLYVNRLLQDRDLTDAQRRNIVESLDRARSLREVKLLYKGLSESIGNRKAARQTVVNESARGPSPTTRPLASSAPRLDESAGVEVHRWALLAGINKA